MNQRSGFIGIDVYVHNLKVGTKFRCNSGAWDGLFIVDNGVAKVVSSGKEIFKVDKKQILTITTDDKIPFVAFVYPSVYYALELKKEAVKLNNLHNKINDQLLTKDEMNQVSKDIQSTLTNLQYLQLKFESMDSEVYIR